MQNRIKVDACLVSSRMSSTKISANCQQLETPGSGAHRNEHLNKEVSLVTDLGHAPLDEGTADTVTPSVLLPLTRLARSELPLPLPLSGAGPRRPWREPLRSAVAVAAAAAVDGAMLLPK